MPSPLHPYSAPPHLHGLHQSSPASAVPASLGGLLSPPESRTTSGDEKESQRSTAARQSLPSIHEALGGSEQSLPYSAPVPPPSAMTSAPHWNQSSTATSPADPRPRTFSSDLHASQGPANPFSHPRSPYQGVSSSQPPPPPPPQTSRPPLTDPRPPYSTVQHNPKLPSLHLKTAPSPPPGAARPPNPPYSYPPSSATAAPPSAGPMNHYPYPQYSSSSHPLSTASQSAPNSGYPPSATYPPPPRYAQPSSWRDGPEMARLEEKKINPTFAPYGESVKRHLESFDLEASLNEVCIHVFLLTQAQLTLLDGGRFWPHCRVFQDLPPTCARESAHWNDSPIHAEA